MNIVNSKLTLLMLTVGVAVFAVMLVTGAPTFSQIKPEISAERAPGVIQRATVEESKSAFDNEEAIFVDVRSVRSFEASHIPGALSIPLSGLRTRIGELDPNQWIMTYCT